MRIALAEIAQETDSFSPLVSNLSDFEACGLFFGDEILQRMRGVGPLGGFLEVASQQPESTVLLPLVRAWGGAGGTIAAVRGTKIEYRANPDGSVLRVKEVARVELGAQNEDVDSRLNGEPSVAIGLYLPIGTTFAIFIGGLVRWMTDTLAVRRGMNEAQKIRVESVGVLAASGMIAGEALTGIVTAWFNYKYGKVPAVFESPSYIAGIVVLVVLGYVLVKVPLANAGRPEDPAPPAAIV